jgi:periplasmic copper chaperone A
VSVFKGNLKMTQKPKSGILGIVLAGFAVIVSLVFLASVLKQDRLDTRVAGIYVNNGYARVNGVSAQTGAAFMVIENTGDEDDRLIDVVADVANMASLHSNKTDANGMAMMRPIDGGIVIPAHGLAELKRGANHLMMMGLKKSLKQDDVVTLFLTFEKAGTIIVRIPVDLNR